MNLMTVLLLGGAAWFLFRSPGSGQPSLLSTFLSSAHGVPALPPAAAGLPVAASALPQAVVPLAISPAILANPSVLAPPGAGRWCPPGNPNLTAPGSVPPPGGWGPFDPLLFGSGYYGCQ